MLRAQTVDSDKAELSIQARKQAIFGENIEKKGCESRYFIYITAVTAVYSPCQHH
jgi:hypothetical protein